MAKHANATQGTVRGRVADDIIEISITDNGVGFETENSTPGLGIRMIRDYVDAARGTVGVESAPGNGTTITVTLPIKGLAGSANGMLEDSLLAVA